MSPPVLALSHPGPHSRASPLTLTARDQEADKAEGTVEREEYLALAFRMGIEELVMENNKSGKDAIRDPRVVALMDLSTHAALQSWVAKQVPLLIMYEMMEAQTADQCSDAFAYLEQRVELLRALTNNGEDKRSTPALLRCCNLLMQRLSKASSLLLCGRVLMLLAQVIPLTEKSSVNLKGEFNKATGDIPYSVELEGEEAARLASEGGDVAAFKLKSTDEKLDGQMEVSFGLYKTFWGLQKSLHDPLSLINGSESVEEVVSAVGLVLDHLTSYALEAEAEVDADGGGGEGDADSHFPGFLTDTKLIALEFQDPVFRRQILVQLLVVMHYLLDRSVHPAKAPEMSRKAKADLTALQERAFKVLAATPPRSRAAGLVETLKCILQRENNWTAWKKAKCPDFKRSDTSQKKAEGDDEDGVIQVGDKRKDIWAATAQYKKRFFNAKVRDSFIPEALSSGDAMLICKPRVREVKKDDDIDYHPVKLEDRLDIVRMEADPANDIDEEYRRNGNTCWRWVTLRMLAAYDSNLFEVATVKEKWLEGVVKEMDKDKKGARTADVAAENEGKDETVAP